MGINFGLYRPRSREWAAWLLTTGTLVAIFEAYPDADLWLSGMVYGGGGVFPLSGQAWVQGLYHATPWVGRTLFIGSLFVCMLAVMTHRLSRPALRRASAVAIVMALGLGVLVHAALKENWGRPRPHQVQDFAGTQAFVPALRPWGACSRNCSFVSGHAATGFALLAMGMFGSRARRRLWFAAAMLAGLAIGAGRVVQGGHFVSDVLFAGVLMWLTAILTREAWLRIVSARRARAARCLAAPAGSEAPDS